MSIKSPFVTGPCTLRIQTNLFHNELAHVERSLASTVRALEVATRAGAVTSAEVVLGDCSPTPLFGQALIARWQEEFRARGIGRFDYQFFNANLGSAGGHNRLAKSAQAELILIENPDVVSTPNLIVDLIEPLRRPGVGQVDARQAPLEHPKHYDQASGETGWATGACSLIPRQLWEELGGYDHETFFLYCDDVDLSWRVRLAGYRVIFQPSAVVFHDKRLSPDGLWMPSAAEEYYSAEAGLFIAHKYSRPRLVGEILDYFAREGTTAQKRAAAQFERRRVEHRLPAPIDGNHRVSEFVHGNYTKHRW